MSYEVYAASVDESPFKLYSQASFSYDLKIGQPSHCQLLLQQQRQQSQQRTFLQQHICSKLQQHGSQQLHRCRIKWPVVLGSLLVAAVVAALLMFTPLGKPLSHPSTGANTMAPSSGLVNCQVQHAGSSYSSLCNGDLQYQDGQEAGITVWSHSSQAAAGLSQPGVAGAAAALDDGAAANGVWDAVSGHHRRRQRHRKLVRFT